MPGVPLVVKPGVEFDPKEYLGRLYDDVKSKTFLANAAKTNYHMFVKLFRDHCKEIYEPCSASVDQLERVETYLNETTQLLSNLEDALARVRLIPMTYENRHQIDDALQSITDNEFALLDQHMSQRKENALYTLPNLDYTHASANIILVITILMAHRHDKSHPNASLCDQLLNSTLELLTADSKHIDNCGTWHKRLADIKINQEQQYEQAGNEFNKLNDMVAELLSSPNNSPPSIAPSTSTEHSLSASQFTLHGRNSQAAPNSGEPNKEKSKQANPETACCLIM